MLVIARCSAVGRKTCLCLPELRQQGTHLAVVPSGSLLTRLKSVNYKACYVEPFLLTDWLGAC